MQHLHKTCFSKNSHQIVDHIYRIQTCLTCTYFRLPLRDFESEDDIALHARFGKRYHKRDVGNIVLLHSIFTK